MEKLGSGSNKRQKQTQLINGCMVKADDGRGWLMDPTAPVLTQVRERKDKSFKTDQAIALPRTLMMAKCGGRTEFEEALRCGEIEQVDDGSNEVAFYAFRQYVVGKTTERSNTRSVSRPMAASASDVEALEGKMDQLGWSFDYVGGGSTPKALMDAEMSDMAAQKLREAQDGLAKVGCQHKNTRTHRVEQWAMTVAMANAPGLMGNGNWRSQ